MDASLTLGAAGALSGAHYGSIDGGHHAGSWEAVPPASETGEVEHENSAVAKDGAVAAINQQGNEGRQAVEFQEKGEGVGVACSTCHLSLS